MKQKKTKKYLYINLKTKVLSRELCSSELIPCSIANSVLESRQQYNLKQLNNGHYIKIRLYVFVVLLQNVNTHNWLRVWETNLTVMRNASWKRGVAAELFWHNSQFLWQQQLSLSLIDGSGLWCNLVVDREFSY